MIATITIQYNDYNDLYDFKLAVIKGSAIHGFGVYDWNSICAEILSHNEMDVFTEQYKANHEIQQYCRSVDL